MDGFGQLRELRAENIDTPVILLYRPRRLEDKITGLDFGADDYLASLLPQRSWRACQRLRQSMEKAPKLTHGDLTVNTYSRSFAGSGW